MALCKYLIRVEFSQSQSRAAYFENFAEFRELRVELRQYTEQVCMLYNASEISRLVLLFDHSLVVSRLSAAVSKADYLARDLYDHSRFSSTSAAIVRMSRGGSGSGVSRLIGKRISRPKVNRYGVNPVASEIVDRYASNTADTSGSQSYGRFCTAGRSIKISVRLNLSHFPFA